MRRHNQMLFRTARSILRDDQEARRWFRRVSVAYRGMHHYRGGRGFRLVDPVVASARSAAGNVWRDRAIFAAVDVPAGDEEDDNMGESRFPNPNPPPPTAMRRLLESHIDALPDLYRSRPARRRAQQRRDGRPRHSRGDGTHPFFRARHLLSQALARIWTPSAVYACRRPMHWIVAGVLARLQRRSV